MKSEIISQQGNVIVIKAEKDEHEFQNAINAAVKSISRKANLKGFRKGHVPRKTLELLFGKQVFCTEALEELLPGMIQDLVEEYDMVLIEEPDIKVGTAEEGKPMDVEITFSVRPEVTLPDIETLEATSTRIIVDEALIDKNVDKILESNTRLDDLLEDRAVANDDIVDLEYSSFVVDGDDLKPLEEPQKAPIEMSNPTLRREIVEAILGKTPGDQFELDLKVDEDYRNDDLAGKDVRYTMRVLGFKKKVKPELDDKFASTLTRGECATAEEFRERIKKELLNASDNTAKETLRTSAMDALCDASEVELPEKMVLGTMEDMKQEHRDRVAEEVKMSWEDFVAQSGIDEAEVWARLRERAEERVKRSFVVEVLVEREGIQCTRDDMDEAIGAMATTARVEPGKLQKYIYAERSRIADVANRVLVDKVMNFLSGKVRVLELEKTEEEMEKEAALKQAALAAAETISEAIEEEVKKDETQEQ